MASASRRCLIDVPARRRYARPMPAPPGTTPMRIGHCQLHSLSGDFDANLAKVVRGLERADRERVEIVSFPECFLTGYQDREPETRRHAFAVDSPKMRTV